ncbi:MAG: tRNA (adenosine(37)-N6)-threonylcarbamoyltransferase complex transferase subunit TsaD [Alphaproteobacteria bacterium]|nr:MAG: tRNA (adenosine(37)-N6)-threonylcarbamoyltransferase complex transferase subunit TsaD [Alphaproteobacteria bacterium]
MPAAPRTTRDPRALPARPMLVLGIESSCDDTAAALVREPDGPLGPDRRPVILASEVMGQSDLHAGFGGVVPEIAARAHAERLDLVTRRALEAAGVGLEAIDAVAVTAGPGLIGGVMAGVTFAKALARARGLPLIGVNHLAGHALSVRLSEGIGYPYLLLLVSGGHCQLLEVRGPTDFRRLGGTIDDAPGEAFDKVARLMGLPQPGGPAVEHAAAAGDASRFRFPRPLPGRRGLDMSFSGLKTAVAREIERLTAERGGLSPEDVADIAASFQAAVADVLARRVRDALAQLAEAAPPGGWTLAVAGGVAANRSVRAALEAACVEAGARFAAPPLALCTDNGAMIAWAGAELLRAGHRDGADLAGRPRWPLDARAPALLGGGRKGAKA